MAKNDGWRPTVLSRLRLRFKKSLYHLSPALLYRLRSRLRTGRWPRLKDPHTFDEKLAFLMLYWRHPLKTRCADKYLLRSYVEEHKLGHLLPELIGVYKDSREIDFARLPGRFVLKCTHGWSYNIICLDKRQLDPAEARRKLDAWMSTDFSMVFGEIHYAGITPRIICEPFLDDATGQLPIDYKLFCFAGKVDCVMVCMERGVDGQGPLHHFYDRDWKRTLFYDVMSVHAARDLPRVAAYDEMVGAAEILSRPFPFVRIDFYNINGRAVIGEMTFTPCGCVDRDLTDLAQNELGKLIKLPGPYRDEYDGSGRAREPGAPDR